MQRWSRACVSEVYIDVRGAINFKKAITDLSYADPSTAVVVHLGAHYLNLLLGRFPLEAGEYQASKGEQRTEGGDHPSPYHPAAQLLYLGCLFGVGAGLCLLAAWLIWRYANTRAVAAALALYFIVAVLLWHGFEWLL